MSLEQLFYKRNNIINDIFIDREFNNMMENFYIEDLEILQEGFGDNIKNFFKNIIETVKRFFKNLIEKIKNLFRKNKSLDKKTIKEADDITKEARKQKNDQRRMESAKKLKDERDISKEIGNAAKKSYDKLEKNMEKSFKKFDDSLERHNETVRELQRRKREEEKNNPELDFGAKIRSEKEELKEAERKSMERAERLKQRDKEREEKNNEEKIKRDEYITKQIEKEKERRRNVNKKNDIDEEKEVISINHDDKPKQLTEEEELAIKGYKIQGKKITMRNYDEKAKNGNWLFRKVSGITEMFVECCGFRAGIGDEKDPKKYIMNIERRLIERYCNKAVRANIDKIHTLEDLVYYAPLDSSSSELTKTINLEDFNIKYYEAFLDCSDKFTVEYLKKTRDSFIKEINEYKERREDWFIYHARRDVNNSQIVYYDTAIEIATWVSNRLQSLTVAVSKQLFKMKKEIEEIIKTIVKIGNR